MAKKKKQSLAEPVESAEQEEIATSDGDANIIGKVWDFFSSMKLGIILLLGLAVVSIVGTLFIPKDPITGQQDFTRFYNNWFFRILLASLALNLLICSLNRWKQIISTLRGPKTDVSEAFVKNLKTGASFQLKENAGAVTGRLQEILRRKGYRTFNDSKDGATYIAADRGRWGVLGPYLSHISFIIMIVAILIKFSGLMGFEGDLATVVGKTHNIREVSKLQNVAPDEFFDIRLDKFETEFRSDGSVKEWRSTVTVIDKDKTFPFVIKVNTPLVYKGMKFYQMSYGTYFGGKVSSASGGTQEFNLKTNTQNSYVTAPGTDITFLPEGVNPQTQKTTVRIYKGQQEGDVKEVELNKPLVYETASMEINDIRDYSFFSVKRDPTVPYMGFASVLLIVAVTFSFLLKHRRLWAVIKDQEDQSNVVIGGLSQKHKADFQQDFDSTIAELKGERGGLEHGLR